MKINILYAVYNLNDEACTQPSIIAWRVCVCTAFEDPCGVWAVEMIDRNTEYEMH